MNPIHFIIPTLSQAMMFVSLLSVGFDLANAVIWSLIVALLILALSLHSSQLPQSSRPTIIMADLLAFAGVDLVVWNQAFASTAVDLSDGRSVHNIGLLADRQNLTLIGLALAVSGLLIFLLHKPTLKTPMSPL